MVENKACSVSDLKAENTQAANHTGWTHSLLSIMGGESSLGWIQNKFLQPGALSVPQCGEAPLQMRDNSHVLGTNIIQNNQLGNLQIYDQNHKLAADIQTTGPVRIDMIKSNSLTGNEMKDYQTMVTWTRPNGNIVVSTHAGWYSADTTDLDRRDGHIK